MPTPIIGLVKKFQDWAHKPDSQPDTLAQKDLNSGKTVQPSDQLSTSPLLSKGKARSHTGIKHRVAKALGLTMSKKNLQLQEKISHSIAKLKEELSPPEALLEKYPHMAAGQVIYQLAQDDSTREDTRNLCEARLNALKKHFSRYPVITFLREKVGWTIRKVAALFSKNVEATANQNISELKKALNTFETDPVAFLNKLDQFEKKHGIFSLSDSLDAQLYFPSDESKNLQPLMIRTQDWVSTDSIEKLKLEKGKLANIPINKLKSQLASGQKKLLQLLPTQPKEIQKADLSDNLEGTETSGAVSDIQNETKQQLDQWRSDAQNLGIPYLTYINLYPSGLIGKLYEENPVLAQQLLKIRLTNLKLDIDKTFSKLIPFRRTKALQELANVETLFNKIDFSGSSSEELTAFLNAMTAYEETFDKKPFMLLFNMEFLRNPETQQPFDFLSVTKYTGFIDRAAHEEVKDKLIQKHFGDMPINFSGLSLPLPTDQPAEEGDIPDRAGDDYGILDNALHTQTSDQSSPLIASGRVLDIHVTLKEALQKQPEKIREMALSLLKPDSDDATRVHQLDFNKSKQKAQEDLYNLLEKPENQKTLEYIQKKLVKDNLLKQLVAFEPNVIIHMLSTTLSDQLIQQHRPAQAGQLKTLLAMIKKQAISPDKVTSFLNREEHADLQHDLQLTVNRYYLSALNNHLTDTEKNVETASQNELLKTLNACDTLMLLHDETQTEQDSFYNTIPDKKNLLKKQRLIEAELAWRFTQSEQFCPTEKRIYMLSSPSRADFIQKATSEKLLSIQNRSRVDQWFSNWCKEQVLDPDALIFDHIAQNYLPSLRKYHSVPYHVNLTRLQQSRYDILAFQKNYVYSEALKSLEGKNKGVLIKNSPIEEYKERLKAIDIRQMQVAPSRPAESDSEKAQGTALKLAGISETLNLNDMLDNIEWSQYLIDIKYNYWESLKEKFGFSKAQAVTEPKEFAKKQIKNFADTILDNLPVARAIARKNPLLFRKTCGEFVSELPSIAGPLGITQLDAQLFAAEFTGNPKIKKRKEPEALTEQEKEWIKKIQFCHDSIRYCAEITDNINIAAKMGDLGLKGATAGLLAGGPIGAGIGGAAGATLGAILSLKNKVTKAVVNKMSPESQGFLNQNTSSESSVQIAEYTRILGNAAQHGRQLASNQSGIKKLFYASKIALLNLPKPIVALQTQFHAISKAFRDARLGKIGGWRAFAYEVLPVAAIIAGGLFAAAVAAASVALTWGITLGVFTAALGAFASTSWALSNMLLNKTPYNRVLSNTYTHFQEQSFEPDSALARTVKKQCQKEADKLFAGHLMKNEAFQELEEQEVLRTYYQNKTYWQKYCQQQLQNHEASQAAIQQFEQQCDNDFYQWVKKTNIRDRAKEIASKQQALNDIDHFLDQQDSADKQKSLEKRLKDLGIIDRLPSQETRHFLRLTRDEINEYIHLECGTLPLSTDPDAIADILTERCREAYLGYKVKRALDSSALPELESFEATTKKLLRNNHCQRIATNAESHIKALFAEPVKELPTPPPAPESTPEMSAADINEQALNDAMNTGLDAAEKQLAADREEFVDALEDQPPEPRLPKGEAPVIPLSSYDLMQVKQSSDLDQTTNEDEFFDAQEAPLHKPSTYKERTEKSDTVDSTIKPKLPADRTPVLPAISFDQMQKKLQSGLYQGVSGIAQLTKDLMQMNSLEDLLKINLIPDEELANIQKALQIEDESFTEFKVFMRMKLLLKADANNTSPKRVEVPAFMHEIMGGV